jgi:hypothetical protein
MGKLGIIPLPVVEVVEVVEVVDVVESVGVGTAPPLAVSVVDVDSGQSLQQLSTSVRAAQYASLFSQRTRLDECQKVGRQFIVKTRTAERAMLGTSNLNVLERAAVHCCPKRERRNKEWRSKGRTGSSLASRA